MSHSCSAVVAAVTVTMVQHLTPSADPVAQALDPAVCTRTVRAYYKLRACRWYQYSISIDG